MSTSASTGNRCSLASAGGRWRLAGLRRGCTALSKRGTSFSTSPTATVAVMRRSMTAATIVRGRSLIVLIKAGLLNSPMTSKGFRDWGEPWGRESGSRSWASKSHSFITVGGLRLDTGWLSKGDERGPRWKERTRPYKRLRRWTSARLLKVFSAVLALFEA